VSRPVARLSFAALHGSFDAHPTVAFSELIEASSGEATGAAEQGDATADVDEHGHPETEPVYFPDEPDVAEIWRTEGAERAWDAVIDFECDLDAACREAARAWGMDEADVIAAVYGEHFVTPRDALAALMKTDPRRRAELVMVWRQQRADGATEYDERQHWRARGLVTHSDELMHSARPRRPARPRGYPRARRASRAHSRSGDSGDDDPAASGDDVGPLARARPRAGSCRSHSLLAAAAGTAR
jgi:hypothetical protein